MYTSFHESEYTYVPAIYESCVHFNNIVSSCLINIQTAPKHTERKEVIWGGAFYTNKYCRWVWFVGLSLIFYSEFKGLELDGLQLIEIINGDCWSLNLRAWWSGYDFWLPCWLKWSCCPFIQTAITARDVTLSSHFGDNFLRMRLGMPNNFEIFRQNHKTYREHDIELYTIYDAR